MTYLKIYRRKRVFQEVYISIFLFFLFFAPPILPKSNIFLAVYASFFLLVHDVPFKEIMNKGQMGKWLFSMIVIAIYAFFVMVLNSIVYNDLVQIEHYMSLYNRFIVLILTIVPCCIYLSYYMKKIHCQWYEFISYVIYAGLIEAAFVYASFLFSPVKEMLIYIMQKNSGSYLYDNTWYITVRAYGFASSLVDLFGWGMGVIAGISFFYGFIFGRKYIFFSFLIAIAGTLNARTTLVIYCIGILFTIQVFLITRKTKLVIRWIAEITIIIFSAFVILGNIIKYNPTTANWVISGINSLKAVLSGTSAESDFGSKLFASEWWKLQDGIRLLFGTGHSRYGANGYIHTDVGYVNDVWFIGIIGILLLYGSFIGLVIKALNKSKTKMEKFVIKYLLIAIIIFNIKGCAISYNIGASVTFTILFISNYMLRIPKISLWLKDDI